MSRDISSTVLEQFRAGELMPVCLFDFMVDDIHYRYTDLDVSLTVVSGTVSGTFEPRGFKIDSIQYSLGTIVDNANITLDNRDQLLTSLFIGEIVQGSEAYIYGAVLDSNGQIIEAPINIFQGQIDSWELDEEEIRITLTTEFIKWSQRTASLHSSSCRWKKFKGTECQYAGNETQCDRSYTRCSALANTIHFGGFRWLPDLENREIKWGPDSGGSNSVAVKLTTTAGHGENR